MPTRLTIMFIENIIFIFPRVKTENPSHDTGGGYHINFRKTICGNFLSFCLRIYRVQVVHWGWIKGEHGIFQLPHINAIICMIVYVFYTIRSFSFLFIEILLSPFPHIRLLPSYVLVKNAGEKNWKKFETVNCVKRNNQINQKFTEKWSGIIIHQSIWKLFENGNCFSTK